MRKSPHAVLSSRLISPLAGGKVMDIIAFLATGLNVRRFPHHAALLLLLLPSVTIAAEPTPDKIKVYLAACEEETQKAIVAREWDIKNLTKGLTNPARKGPRMSPAEVRRAIKDAKQELADLRAGKIRKVPRPVRAAQVLPDWQVVFRRKDRAGGRS